MNKQKLYVTI